MKRAIVGLLAAALMAQDVQVRELPPALAIEIEEKRAAHRKAAAELAALEARVRGALGDNSISTDGVMRCVGPVVRVELKGRYAIVETTPTPARCSPVVITPGASVFGPPGGRP